MSNDFFQFKAFTVRQGRAAMKVGTDGVLLGAWSAISGSPRRILDVGSGTGLIALMLAQRFPEASVDAVEIDHAAFLDSEENIASSPFSDRVKAYNNDFQSFAERCDVRYDIVVSNPPYFIDAMKNPAKERAMARHSDSLAFADLVAGVDTLLAPQGLFAVILPTESVDAFLLETSAHGMLLSVHVSVKTTERKLPRRHLLLFSKTLPSEIQRYTVCLQNNDGTRSQWYAEETSAFYL